MPSLQINGEGKSIVQLVLPPSLLARINQLASERGVNRSALIREAVELMYFHEPRGETNYQTSLPSGGNQRTERRTVSK